jgi:5-methylcytosine-specific restriction enzyme A
MSRARAAKIFLRENGRCYLCSIKLRIGVDKYQIEHPDPLSLGGSDDDAHLRVVCDPCHKAKTKQDAASKAKRDRLVTAGWDNGSKPKMQSRGFAKSAGQRKATSPITPKFPGDLLGTARKAR